MGKGSDRERDLVNWFCDLEDGDAFRMAASGGGTLNELPDVFATHKGDLYGIEQKYAGKNREYTSYVQSEEQDALRGFCEIWRAKPLLVFRFSYDTTWYVVELDSDLHKAELTENGTIGGKRSMRDEYDTLDNLLGL